MSDLVAGALGTLQGLVVSTAVVLLLLVGFCVLLNLPKLRASGRRTRVVRSLDEALGAPSTYLPPDAPSGPADQLRTPELLELQARARNTASGVRCEGFRVLGEPTNLRLKT